MSEVPLYPQVDVLPVRCTSVNFQEKIINLPAKSVNFRAEIRQLSRANKPGRTNMVSPNRARQRYRGTSLTRNCPCLGTTIQA